MYEKFSSKSSAMLLIDYQEDKMRWVHSFPRGEIKRNVIVLAKAANILKIPIIITSSIEENVKDTLLKELQDIFLKKIEDCIKRDGMVDCMNDHRVAEAVRATGRKKLIIAGITTDISIVFPAIRAVQEGYEVQVVVDACGSPTRIADETAHRRIEAAGATLTSTNQIIAELAQNWSTEEGNKLRKILYADILSKL